MNTPNPLTSPSLFEEKCKSQARVKKAFFFALSASVLILLTALIVQGCKREEAPPVIPDSQDPTMAPPAFDATNAYAPVETSAPPAGVTSTALPPAGVSTPVPAYPVSEPAAVAIPTPAPATSEYVVAKGDSFYTIGKKLGVSMKAIAEANPGVDSSRLKIGQKLNIPAGAAAAPSGVSAPTAEPAAAVQTYTVKSGDNLTKIANKFGVTVKALRTANNLKVDRIKVGDKLKIPGKPAAPAPVAEPAPAPVTPVLEPIPAAPPVTPPPGQ